MARSLRTEYEGAVYYVTSRGTTGESVFGDEKDRGLRYYFWHGHSQKEVADYIGIHYSVISKLLKG